MELMTDIPKIYLYVSLACGGRKIFERNNSYVMLILSITKYG